MAKWGVAEAKARFSAVLDKAETEGPQLVERRKTRFVLLTEAQWAERNAVAEPPAPGKTSGHVLWDALRLPPEDQVDFELPRPKWQLRKVDL
jgi:Antitoxin Phd_YefM, type II toxin-antitoxin system